MCSRSPAAGGIPASSNVPPCAGYRSCLDAPTASGFSSAPRVPLRAGIRIYFPSPPKAARALRLPLPMAYQGPDVAGWFAHCLLTPAAGVRLRFHDFRLVGKLPRGPRASTIWLTALPSLDSVEIPHEQASDFFPVWSGQRIYFLSGRAGPIGIFSYDPATKRVAESAA